VAIVSPPATSRRTAPGGTGSSGPGHAVTKADRSAERQSPDRVPERPGAGAPAAGPAPRWGHI